MKSLKTNTEMALDEPTIASFPTFYVSGEQMSEIDSWEVDGEYTLKVKVRMSSYRSHMEKGGKLHSNASFDMLEYSVE